MVKRYFVETFKTIMYNRVVIKKLKFQTVLLPNYIKNCIEMAICYFHLFQLLLLIL